MIYEIESYDHGSRVVVLLCLGGGRRAERVTSLDEPAVGRVTSPRGGRWPPSTLQRSPPPPAAAAPTSCLNLPSYITWINCIIWPERPPSRPGATFRLKHWNFICCLLSRKASFIFVWKILRSWGLNIHCALGTLGFSLHHIFHADCSTLSLDGVYLLQLNWKKGYVNYYERNETW